MKDDPDSIVNIEMQEEMEPFVPKHIKCNKLDAEENRQASRTQPVIVLEAEQDPVYTKQEMSMILNAGTLDIKTETLDSEIEIVEHEIETFENETEAFEFEASDYFAIEPQSQIFTVKATDYRVYSTCVYKKPEVKKPPERKFACQKCSKKYAHQYTLTSHLKWECGNIKKFKCPYCEVRKTLAKNIYKHVSSSHRDSEVGSLILYEDNTKSAEQEEQWIPYYGNKARPKIKHYECDNCSKVYQTRKRILVHFKRCLKEPKYSCPYCSFRGRRYKNIFVHIRKLHKTKKIYALDNHEEVITPKPMVRWRIKK